MTSSSRLGRQLVEALTLLNQIGARHALIGGLALASHKVIRATQDIDLLVDLDDADRIEVELRKAGYSRLQRSDDAANYSRRDERLDLLYAHRPAARRLLAEATEHNSALGTMRVISTEGLIGFKLQGFVNDSRRTQDLEDIRALLRANRTQLKLDEIREYFRLFDKEALLDELLHEIA